MGRSESECVNKQLTLSYKALYTTIYKAVNTGKNTQKPGEEILKIRR